MRQYLYTKDVSYNAIFYSAFKALIVFELLLSSPRTLDQISDFLAKLPYIKANISKDTLRVYINTFKNAGCKIEKKLTGEQRREYSYFIPDNPFRPVISAIQAQMLFDIYDIIMYNMPFEELLKVEILIKKLNSCFKDKTFHELYNSHSILKDFDINVLKELAQCCKENDMVTVLYNSPRSGFKEISIIAHNMKIQNYKLYLEGFGMEYKEEAIFLLSRIVKITNIIPGAEVKAPTDNSFVITFELYNPEENLAENETVISQSGNTRTVKHTTNNRILSTQRFLQLADSCKILEPANFKQEFISALKAAKEVYLYGN